MHLNSTAEPPVHIRVTIAKRPLREPPDSPTQFADATRASPRLTGFAVTISRDGAEPT